MPLSPRNSVSSPDRTRIGAAASLAVRAYTMIDPAIDTSSSSCTASTTRPFGPHAAVSMTSVRVGTALPFAVRGYTVTVCEEFVTKSSSFTVSTTGCSGYNKPVSGPDSVRIGGALPFAVRL